MKARAAGNAHSLDLSSRALSSTLPCVPVLANTNRLTENLIKQQKICPKLHDCSFSFLPESPPCPSSLPWPSLSHRPLPGPDAFTRGIPRPPGGASALLLQPGWLSSVLVCFLLFVILFWGLGWLPVLSWDLLGRGRGPHPGTRARLCLLHATSPVIRVQIPAAFGTVVLRGVPGGQGLWGCGCGSGGS